MGSLVPALRCTRCARLRQSVVCRIGRHCVASGSAERQPAVLLFVAHCGCTVKDDAALRGYRRSSDGLLSAATGCGQLQRKARHCNRSRCVATGCHALQRVRLRRSRLHSAATGIALRFNRWRLCTALQQVERRSAALGNSRIVLGCNTHNSVASDGTVLQQVLRGGAQRCCDKRCAVATNGQQCRLRRRTNLRRAVANRDVLLQRVGNTVGCVVARTCGTHLQHAMRRCKK